jgi:hypothetical protein
MSDATLNARADVKDSVQASIMKCEHCGRRCVVVQETAYEFSMECVCGQKRLISWAHAEPPPRVESAQRDLFD